MAGLPAVFYSSPLTPSPVGPHRKARLRHPGPTVPLPVRSRWACRSGSPPPSWGQAGAGHNQDDGLSTDHTAPIQGQLGLHLRLHVAGDAGACDCVVTAAHRHRTTVCHRPGLGGAQQPQGIVDLEVGAEHQSSGALLHQQAGGREVGLAQAHPLGVRWQGQRHLGQRPRPLVDGALQPHKSGGQQDLRDLVGLDGESGRLGHEVGATPLITYSSHILITSLKFHFQKH